MELLKFSNDIEASDTERRIIAGKIVPYATEIGNTSAGAVIFAADSIEIPANKKIKLLDEHNPKAILGSATTFSTSPEGIFATFKVTKTARGDEALTLASDGLKTGLSVGVEPIESSMNKNGVIVVTKGILREVSHVASPAFASAEITKVSASAEAPVETTTIESEAVQVEDTTKDTVAPEAVETPSVEASRPTISASVAYAKPRIEVTPLSLLENTIKANIFNDDAARQFIAAASDTTTTEVAGLVPTRQLTEIINPKSTGVRPSIDAISAGTLPDAGMKFQIPRVKTAPTVAVAAEKGAFSDTQVEIEYVDVDVKKYAGMQLFDVEVLDRTSPAFLSELLALMGDAYAKATNTAVNTAMATNGTLDATTVTLPWDGEEFAGFIARAGESIYSNTFKFATGVIVSPKQWSNIVSLVDGNKRPLFNAAAPQNAAGDVMVNAIRGTVLGLPLYVDYTMTGEADNSIIVVNSDSYTWYESPRLQLRAEKVGTGQVEIGMYGYGAIATKVAAGAFKFNKA